MGIFINGNIFVQINQEIVKTLSIGDMTGHMLAADLAMNENHQTDLIAATDGLIAVLPLGELKAEIRRNPEAVFKVMQVASKYAMETFMYNLYG